MKHTVITSPDTGAALDVPAILERVASVSARPRYTMLVLEMIARLARDKGKDDPWIQDGDCLVTVLEWLCDALSPMAARNPKRLALAEQVRTALVAEGRLPADPDEAAQMIDLEVRERVRSSGLTGVSRAVTELVNAGLITRHYQGYRVAHENRGAQRHAVYTVPQSVRTALGGEPVPLKAEATDWTIWTKSTRSAMSPAWLDPSPLETAVHHAFVASGGVPARPAIV